MAAAPAAQGAAPQAAAIAPQAAAGAMPTGDTARIAEERATANVMNNQFAQQCQTCKNRRYVDGSNDPGVSFKAPTAIAPGASASAVAGHEQEHVMREQASAREKGGEVVSQSVVLHGANCPECGRYYIAGGTTTTVSRSGGQQKAPAFRGEEALGRMLDATA